MNEPQTSDAASDTAPASETGRAREMGAFSDHLGLEIVEASGSRLRARWHLGPHLHQPYGLVHGGAHAAVVETLGSIGANLALDGAGVSVGVNNNTDFYRATKDGVLDAVAFPVHQGSSQQVWQVEIRDDAQRLVARGVLRVQNLPSRAR